MQNRLLATVSLGAAALLLSGCSGSEAPPEQAAAQPERAVVTASPDSWGEWGIDRSTADPDTAPGEDFYRHVNGAWLDAFEIPADRTRYGSFDLLREKSEQRVRFIIDDLAEAGPDPSTPAGKVAAFYNAFLNTPAIEDAGLEPARPVLDRIEAVGSLEDLARAFGDPALPSPFSAWVDVDSKQTDRYIAYFGYGGLGIGDRDDYLEDSEKARETRAAYLTMLETLLDAAGYEDPAAAAQSVLELETALAEVHWDRAASRDRNLTYNLMTPEEIAALAPGFPAREMIAASPLAGEGEIVVRQVTPTAEEAELYGLDAETLEKVGGGGVAGVMEIAGSADLDAWKAWMTVRHLAAASDVLPARIDDAVFDFYGRTLRGQEEQRERWKRAVSATEGALGEAVGAVYAERFFPAENKAAMDELVANLRVAMRRNLEDIDWMGEATKAEAREKLAAFEPMIGYPDAFETYDTLEVGEDAYANWQAARAWGVRDTFGKLGQPIDRGEWFMLPQTVNAYYSPNRNQIVFPAAILQPPFFNLSADPAVNYGAIGGVIGHEIGHGFDDQGSKSDGAGTLRNWWTEEDASNFDLLTGALVDQYNSFCPLDDGETCMNGRLSLGENVGDLGGLSMAYRAYRISLDEDGDGAVSADEEAPVIDGLTGDQRFFKAWAQVWRSKYREEAMRRQLRTGPHSLPYYRVNGVVANMDAWYDAFDVSEDDPMWIPPEDRIQIW